MNNAKVENVRSIDLGLFGGLYTEADPSDLPPGASPLVINCDYFVGKVDQRGGKQSVYTGAPTNINFDYLKTFEQEDGDIFTLALGSDGTIYREDVLNAQGTLAAIYAAVFLNSFAQSSTQLDREYIALSDLQQGTDIPLCYDGTNFDRLSQEGPCQAPTCTPTTAGSAIASITQNPPYAIPSSGSHRWILVSDSPGDHGTFGTPSTPGNVFTLFFSNDSNDVGFPQPVPSYLKVGMNIVVSGFPTINGFRLNNDPTGVAAPKFYTITFIGQAIPGLASYAAISFVVPFTTFFNVPQPPGCSLQATIATLTTVAQVPNLEVGDSLQIAGTGGAPPTGYDGTYTVLQTPNAAQLQVVSTVLNNNKATYAFNVVTGSPPTVGESIAVSGTLNGNGIFNVTNAVIVQAAAGTFTINLTGPNVASAPEQGSAIISGTIFLFDPLTIVGNKTGGTIVTSGLIAPGQRQCCYSFLTRHGYLTRPSQITTFQVPSGASAIAVAQLLTGPPDTIARVIHFTPAEGSDFYNIPDPVSTTVNGIVTKSTSTWVLDNTTTGVKLSFTDDALLGAGSVTAVDVQGNNLFETPELGGSVALIPYANRMFALGENNKVVNFRNLSFDGGRVTTTSAGGAGSGGSSTSPAGWTVDPTNGAGGSVVASPIFGFAYQISGGMGMITQPAFQDEFNVPIIAASTTYSVRITAEVLAAVASGNLVVDLFNPATGLSVGSFSLPLSSLGTRMQLFSGTLLTSPLAPVPTGLLLRLYAQNLPGGATVLVDRVEPFPTEAPTLGQQLLGSYENNFEAFDRVTGVVDASSINQQPIKSAFVLFDQLHMVKTGSFVAVRQVKGLEPVDWGVPRTISPVVGTPSVYGVTTGIDEPNSGEEWAIIAGQAGAFIYNGGEPIKLSEEIQSLWNQINWAFGHTLWVKNDVINRRILFGVPMKVPNTWIPAGLIPANSNPTTPNIILELSYKQLTTAGQLASGVGIHPTFYGGRLLATEYKRKWSVWTIQAPCAAFVKRNDNTVPLFLGNSAGTGKVYNLVDGLLNDDGAAIPQFYDTYGFPSVDQEEQQQLGSVRKTYEFMTILANGNGTLTINVFPDSLQSPFARSLLPGLALSSTPTDLEIPVNEIGYRLFVQFTTNQVNAGFQIAKMMMMMRSDPWSPVRGRN